MLHLRFLTDLTIFVTSTTALETRIFDESSDEEEHERHPWLGFCGQINRYSLLKQNNNNNNNNYTTHRHSQRKKITTIYTKGLSLIFLSFFSSSFLQSNHLAFKKSILFFSPSFCSSSSLLSVRSDFFFEAHPRGSRKTALLSTLTPPHSLSHSLLSFEIK